MRLGGLNLQVSKALLSTQYANMLEYRVEIALWALSGVLPFIMLTLWNQTGASTDFGFSSIDLSRYFLSAFLVRQFSVVWVVFSFEEDALLGRLSPYLLQPLHPLWRYASAHLAEQFTRLPFAALITLIFFIINPKSFWVPSLSSFLLAWLSTLLAFTIAFLLQSLIASFCFWSEKASAFERLLFVPYLFLSGLLAPLASFPIEISKLALWTPFPYLINFPAKILSGINVNIIEGFLAQICWIIILLPLVIIFWRLGVRHYTAMGA
ncbi:ABC transporter permease [Prochlorococcus sp. MIT 1223]|uniref:ABC transporter permease n=1 Tax=Prochlorococcus sp. MIT 1223 TaxID=3096217 RepID=UPI002A7581C4|nr:ABC-2 family transporter protein [Prochlorococcus sp. MIT 1223]